LLPRRSGKLTSWIIGLLWPYSNDTLSKRNITSPFAMSYEHTVFYVKSEAF
jgi:hypothetical protein